MVFVVNILYFLFLAHALLASIRGRLRHISPSQQNGEDSAKSQPHAEGNNPIRPPWPAHKVAAGMEMKGCAEPTRELSYGDLLQSLADRDKEIANHKKEIANHKKEIADRDMEIAELKKEK